jgi:hypothetical protein
MNILEDLFEYLSKPVLVFLGFAFSMIFAHAPIILPGVLKLQVNIFSRSLYVWFILLQLSLVIRIASVFDPMLFSKQTGGLLNGIAILGFILNIIVNAVYAKRISSAKLASVTSELSSDI